MKNINDFKNKKVLVLGLAVSGYSASKLLIKLGAEVIVNDSKDLNNDDKATELSKLGAEIISGSHPLSLLEDSIDVMIKNPGIPYSNPLIKKALEKSIPILTEIELAYLITESPIIAITGTNGKTTTTKMIEAVMKHNRQKGQVYASGNIGTPASTSAQSVTSEDDTIMEVSSFQLMGIQKFKPSIAVITNIYSAHLDYHKTRDEYVEAKLAITKNQTEQDYLIYNADQSELTDLVLNRSRAQLIPFSRKKELNKGVWIENGTILFNSEPIMNIEEIILPGKHNLENILATIAVAKIKGVSNESIQSVFKRFKGVPHRMQYVDEVNSRLFYNDSKATNTLATIHALDGFKKPVILIAGGMDRGDSYEDLIPVLRTHVKALITFGETAEKLAQMGKETNLPKVEQMNTVAESVRMAYELSHSGDVILLSPASASWDQYKTFEERGDDFINEVSKLSE